MYKLNKLWNKSYRHLQNFDFGAFFLSFPIQSDPLETVRLNSDPTRRRRFGIPIGMRAFKPDHFFCLPKANFFFWKLVTRPEKCQSAIRAFFFIDDSNLKCLMWANNPFRKKKKKYGRQSTVWIPKTPKAARRGYQPNRTWPKNDGGGLRPTSTARRSLCPSLPSSPPDGGRKNRQAVNRKRDERDDDSVNPGSRTTYDTKRITRDTCTCERNAWTRARRIVTVYKINDTTLYYTPHTMAAKCVFASLSKRIPLHWARRATRSPQNFPARDRRSRRHRRAYLRAAVFPVVGRVDTNEKFDSITLL